MKLPLIYNLFPRLAGHLNKWPGHAERARSMGFNWIFFNPVSQPGFSGSLYSVKDYNRVCSDFLPPGSSDTGLDELRATLAQIRKIGLKPIMDLVINHTAIDCDLVHEHPNWYKQKPDGTPENPYAVDPNDSSKVTVWGDLAEIDNEGSEDREALWQYWLDLIRNSMSLGFCGFRCDAAYKVPAELWAILVQEAKSIDPEATFFAETLGCQPEEVRALRPSGMQYLFNSSKYWAFDAAWAIDQHTEFGAIGPSISFPESHDTARLMADTGGNEAVQRQRYLWAALFSEGLMMPMGYEFGFTRPLHVVHTRPEDWEETGLDFTSFIWSVNRFKSTTPVLQHEGTFDALSPFDQPNIILSRSHAQERIFVLVNKDWHRPQTVDVSVVKTGGGSELIRFEHTGALRREALHVDSIELAPAEIALVG